MRVLVRFDVTEDRRWIVARWGGVIVVVASERKDGKWVVRPMDISDYGREHSSLFLAQRAASIKARDERIERGMAA